MARSIPVIYNQLLQAKNAQSNLTQLNSNSQVSIWNLWLWITAVGQNLFEQLCDLFQTNMESLISNAPVFSLQWIAQMCKNFQYSVSNPQFLQVNVTNTYPYVTVNYPSVNTSLCPVTQAAVAPTSNRTVVVKVATGAYPNIAPLDGSPGITGPICTALVSYLKIIMPPGTQWSLLNVNADQVYIQANVFVNGAYMGTVQPNMNTAINNFFAGVPFNGIFEVSQLMEAMLAVPGVTDVILNNVQVRPYNISFGNGTNLVLNNALVNRNWATFAGYAIPETTGGHTLTDSITYNPA